MKELFNNMLTIDKAYDIKKNNFHLMRFIFASGVIFSHSWILLLGPNGQGEFFAQYLTHGQALASTFSVSGFFVISGFLVMQSLINSPTAVNFMTKRLLRLLPALVLSLAVCAFFIAPLLANIPLRSFLRLPEAGPLNFFFKNMIFGILGDAWSIQGVFEHNPFPNTINGSLWTLKYELVMYIGLALMQFSSLKVKKLQLLIGFVLITVFMLLDQAFNIRLFNPKSDYWWVLNTYNQRDFFMLAFYFMSGSMLYIFKDKIPMNIYLIIGLTILLVAASNFGHLNYVTNLVFPYLVISVCINKRFALFAKPGDFSYGIYIYAFPIQQLVALLWRQYLSVPTFFLVSFAITLTASIISWKFIEEPVLNIKHKLRSRQKEHQAMLEKNS